jgi:tRNA A37 threonylcarbamoyladenosine synthetase subunit TsaC/SUA5/YrdC
MEYKLEDLGDVMRLSIPTETSWGIICFAWEKSNVEFTSSLESQGIDVLVNLLVSNPNTAYQIFVNG